MNSHVLLFIQDLAIIMLIAGVITVLCHRFKQPVVLGYILAGIIIGPHTPPFSFIHDENIINTLAELGIIFLMFSLGLEFDLHKLSKVGFAAVVAAFAEIVLMMWFGYEIGRLFHWSAIDAIFLGAILAISSTTIIVKALEELGLKRESFAQLIFGILIVEDIFAIAILALLSGIAVTGSLHAQDIIVTSIKLASFLAVSLVLGILLVPRVLAYVATFKNKEMLLISVLGICFGFCLLVVKLDYSVALGAFVIGAIIAESRQLGLIEKIIMPLRDMFSAIFFVSVGLLFDPKVVINYALPIIVITLVVVVGKVLSCSIGTFMTGRDAKTSVRVGMGLAQIGEFSFIIASLGMTLQVTSNFLYPIAVAVSAITTFLTPYLIRSSDAFTTTMHRIMPIKVVNMFSLYTTWIENIKPSQDNIEVTKIVRRSIAHLVVNLLIMAAIFFGGAYLATTSWGEKITALTGERFQKTIIWGIALMLSLPFLIAIYRKAKALSMLLAELSVKEKVDKRYTKNIRKMISEIIPVLVLMSVMICIFALSSSLLPPVEMLIIVLVCILIVGVLLYSKFVKWHAKLQIRLLEAMQRDKDHDQSN